MSDSTYYYGTDLDLSEPIFLKAGPLSLLYHDGMIRSIRFGEHEIVKRIYMALRDQFWNTINPIISDTFVDIKKSSFQISFRSEHHKDDIHFSWKGNITGNDDGSIMFSMKGKAQSTFKRNRIGFCILHPIDTCAGRACTIETTDGTLREETFPIFINPWQIFQNVRSISYPASPPGRVTISFTGDTFETEDQRNWTDASYKTYSTPLSIPIPVTVKNGTEIFQSVTLKTDTVQVPDIYVPKPLEIHIPPRNKYQHYVPDVGTMLRENHTLNPKSLELLNTLSLSHIRVNIDLDDENVVKKMESAASICTHLALPSELALYFTSSDESELKLLKQLLNTTQIPVRRFLIYRKGFPVTPAETIINAATILKSHSPVSMICSGTDHYFVEINRNHPPSSLLDMICFSATPQVHTFDNAALMENLPGFSETLKSLALFQDKALCAITPVTLRPRKRPDKPQKFNGYDPRQKGLFCAAWTLGCLIYCIKGGVSSLTFFETTGDGGLMPADGKSVFPVYHVLANFREMNNAFAQICISSDPSRLACVVLYKGISMLMLLANLTDTPQHVTIFNLPGSINIVNLDENSFDEAVEFPLQWRCKKGETRNVNGPFHVIDILPYGITRIEAFTTEQ
ncbi:MAG TPA: hypothetical protein VKY57_11615 [Chitinispirillaceae bacterium]|nr:hypothetical protein [Chitinispirillaceae bacterium]